MPTTLVGAPTTIQHIPSAIELNLEHAFVENMVETKRHWTDLFNEETADQLIVREAVFAGLGTVPNRVAGGSITYDSMQEVHNQSYTMKNWMLGVQINYETEQDDIHNILKKVMRTGAHMAEIANYTIELYCIDLLNSYLTSGTVYTAGGSNYSVASTAHPYVGGTWANRPSAGVGLNIASLEYFAVQHWVANQKNERGQWHGVMPNRLFVSPSEYLVAKRLVNTMKGRPQSADNDDNVIREIVNTVQYNPWFTADGRWGLLGPKAKTGFRMYMRERPNVKQLVPDGIDKRSAIYFRMQRGMTHPMCTLFVPAAA